jgi:UbiD family decarboxylase
MSLRELKAKMEAQRCMVDIARPVSARLEIARLMHKLEGRGVCFRSVQDTDYPVIAGLCSAREYLALGLGVTK